MALALHRAVEKDLLASGRSIVTKFDIDRIMRSTLRKGSTQDGERLVTKRSFPLPRDLPGVFEKLVIRNVLRSDIDFDNIAWRVSDQPDLRAAEVCCVVDPYCYVSHASAMERWGLTNRNPIALQLTRPNSVLWRVLATKEARDYELGSTSEKQGGTTLFAAEPTRRRYFVFPNAVRGTAVYTHNTVHLGSWVAVPDTEIRLATLGQTFCDMLVEPGLCGGMTHVLEVWEEHAATYLEEIIEAINAVPTKIVKVRAGYILDERLSLAHPSIEEWVETSAQRGGSQKLDPTRPYEPSFSEKWMLSINA